MGKAKTVCLELSVPETTLLAEAVGSEYKLYAAMVEQGEEESREALDELTLIEAKVLAAKALATNDRKLYEREALEQATPWHLYMGKRAALPQEIRGIRWDLFSGCPVHPKLQDVLKSLGLDTADPRRVEEPQRDDDFHSEGDPRCEKYDDMDACVAYLRKGGMLLFMPDPAGDEDKTGPYLKGKDNDGRYFYEGRFIAVRRA